jgi:hypothetical protein
MRLGLVSLFCLYKKEEQAHHPRRFYPPPKAPFLPTTGLYSATLVANGRSVSAALYASAQVLEERKLQLQATRSERRAKEAARELDDDAATAIGATAIDSAANETNAHKTAAADDATTFGPTEPATTPVLVSGTDAVLPKLKAVPLSLPRRPSVTASKSLVDLIAAQAAYHERHM